MLCGLWYLKTWSWSRLTSQWSVQAEQQRSAWIEQNWYPRREFQCVGWGKTGRDRSTSHMGVGNSVGSKIITSQVGWPPAWYSEQGPEPEESWPVGSGNQIEEPWRLEQYGWERGRFALRPRASWFHWILKHWSITSGLWHLKHFHSSDNYLFSSHNMLNILLVTGATKISKIQPPGPLRRRQLSHYWLDNYNSAFY